MNILKLEKDGSVLIPYIENANSYFTRMMGLMFRKNLPENRGLLLDPCNQIHTFQMKFPIDAVYLTNDDVIIKIETSIAPRKICKNVKNAKKVLELFGGVAEKIGLTENDKLSFSNAEQITMSED